MANKYCNLDGTKKIKDEYPKISAGFASVEADRAAHINGSADKHAAQHITYSGNQTGATVKEAIDNTKKDINNISMTGSAHDALVTAALVDEEGTDFGAGGEATYLDGRLKKWEQRAKTHEAETMTYEGRKYQIYNPYKNGGSLHLKGQLHFHTTDSDGADTPAVAVTAYKNAGYAFVAKTDHNVIGDDPLVSGIIFIPGVEETSVRHVTAYDITEQTELYGTQEIIDFHRNRSKLCSIAHPSWSGGVISDIEMASYCNYNFTEVFNSNANVYDEARWDAALSTGKKVYALAVDDCHNIAGTDFNKGWIVANVNTIDKASILQALREGNFYASTGNEVTVSLEGNVLTVTSPEASEITFYGNNGRALLTVANTTSAQYTIRGDEMYVRAISKRLSDNALAWSQPIFLETYGGDGREVVVSNTLLSDCSLYAEFGLNVNQSIPHAASTMLVLDKVITASPFLFELNPSDNGAIKILKTGVYEIITTVTFATNTTGYRRLSNQAKQITISAAGGGQTVHCVEIARFIANQLFDVFLTQTSGDALDALAGQGLTAVQIRRIG